MNSRLRRVNAVLLFCFNFRMEKKSHIKTLFIDKTRRYPATKRMLKHSATLKLQKWWRKRAYRNVANSIKDEEPGHVGNMRYRGHDILDPITMDVIKRGLGMCFYISDSVLYVYHTETLLQYFVNSRVFQCPCTRKTFNETELKRLVKKGRSLRIIEADMLSAMIGQNRERLLRSVRDQTNELLAIESVCGLVMNQALQVCNNPALDYLDAYYMLTTSLLVEWSMFVDHFMVLNIHECHSMLLSNYEMLRNLYEQGLDDMHSVLHSILRAVSRKLNNCRQQLNLPPILLYNAHGLLPTRRRRQFIV